MWIGKKFVEAIGQCLPELEMRRKEVLQLMLEVSVTRGENLALKMESVRLRADLDWFKLRLNQVERERGQLIQAAIGVKIAVPEFVPTYENPAAALNEMPDMSTVGGDARDDGGAPVQTSAEPGEGVDYSMMPGYTGDRR